MKRKHKILLVVTLLLVITGMTGWYVRNADTRNDFDPAWITACQQTDKSALLGCWQTLFDTVLKTHGVAMALTLMGELQAKDTRFVDTCHDITHKIGLRAYELFARGKPFDVNEKTAYCSFGFYHGFMETLVIRSGDPTQAREFCVEVGKKLKDTIPDAYYACFHGIGHGWANVHEPKNWGDEHKIIDPALALCEQVVDHNDPEQLLRCATGVFDSLSLAYYNGLAGITMRANDPMWICREQPEKYKGACYRDLMPAILWMGEYNLTTAASLVEKYAEREYAPIAMTTIADNSVRYIPNQAPATTLIPVCRARRSDLVGACITGLGHGAVQFGGVADKEYESGFAFCENALLTATEQDECYINVLHFAKQRYSAQKVAEICRLAPQRYHDLCQ